MGDLKRILMVDDDPDIHQLLRVALQAGDRQIESAFDGLEGLRSIEAVAYDLVMTNLNMPGRVP
jgi:DNA-binding response OmpR family regulator